MALATVRYLNDWDWAAADKEFQRALELNPKSLDACGCYPFYMAAGGHFPQALAYIERAATTDPQSSVIQFDYGGVLLFARRYEDAVPHLRQAIVLEPQNYLAYRALVTTYWKMGRPKDAQAVVDLPELRTNARFHASASGFIAAWLGRRAEALKAAEMLSQPPNPDRRSVALIYFALGDKDRGFEWLTKSLDARELTARNTKVDPSFDNVRSDPRFQALVSRLKIPD